MDNVIEVINKTVYVTVQQIQDDLVRVPPYTYGLLQYSNVPYAKLETKHYKDLA